MRNFAFYAVIDAQKALWTQKELLKDQKLLATDGPMHGDAKNVLTKKILLQWAFHQSQKTMSNFAFLAVIDGLKAPWTQNQ